MEMFSILYVWERQWKKYTQRDALDSYSESIRFESR
jgi:hypothetical protein